MSVDLVLCRGLEEDDSACRDKNLYYYASAREHCTLYYIVELVSTYAH